MNENTASVPLGARVRFTAGPLGLVHDPGDSRFDGTVQAGDVGTVIGPHPLIEEPGWILVALGNDLICPCHLSHVEQED